VATRSIIAIDTGFGIEGVYCHWDGSPCTRGPILLSGYQYRETVRKLISGGSISSLGLMIEPTGKHSFDNPQENVTVYYHRDRGENWANVKPGKFATQDDLKQHDYAYLFTIDNEWIYSAESWNHWEKLTSINEFSAR